MLTAQKRWMSLLLLLSLVWPVITPAHADVNVDFNVFYEELGPYGAWVDHPQYGTVWIPNDTPRDWRPYTYGHWERTREHGWMWASDWDWGWAPFHYGRWFYDAQYGWAWVPGYEWSPAWVAWRSGGEHIGWAPLPPEIGWSGMGLVTSPRVVDYGIAPSHWIFVPDRLFLAPVIYKVIYYPPRYEHMLRITHNVTRYTIVNHQIVNHCIPLKHIERVTHQPVRIVNVREVEHFSHIARQPHEDRYVPIYRPEIKRIDRSPKLFQTAPRRDNSISQPIRPFTQEVPQARHGVRQEPLSINRDPQTFNREPARSEQRSINTFSAPPTSPVIIRREPERVIERHEQRDDRRIERRQDIREVKQNEKLERKAIKQQQRDQRAQEKQQKHDQKKQESKNHKEHRQDRDGH